MTAVRQDELVKGGIYITSTKQLRKITEIDGAVCGRAWPGFHQASSEAGARA